MDDVEEEYKIEKSLMSILLSPFRILSFIYFWNGILKIHLLIFRHKPVTKQVYRNW